MRAICDRKYSEMCLTSRPGNGPTHQGFERTGERLNPSLPVQQCSPAHQPVDNNGHRIRPSPAGLSEVFHKFGHYVKAVTHTDNDYSPAHIRTITRTKFGQFRCHVLIGHLLYSAETRYRGISPEDMPKCLEAMFPQKGESHHNGSRDSE